MSSAIDWFFRHNISPYNLVTAAGDGDLMKIKRILYRGLHPDTKYMQYRAIDIAVEEGQNDVVKLLLEWGADPTGRGPNNKTPLEMATLKKNSVMQKVLNDAPEVKHHQKLIKEGVDPYEPEKESRSTSGLWMGVVATPIITYIITRLLNV